MIRSAYGEFKSVYQTQALIALGLLLTSRQRRHPLPRKWAVLTSTRGIVSIYAFDQERIRRCERHGCGRSV